MNKTFNNRKNLVFVVVSLVVVVELVWGSSYLKNLPQPAAPTQAATGALLSFSPAQKITKVGEELDIELYLDTKGIKTSGTDVLVSYDPAVVEVLEVRPGLLYQKYPLNEIDVAGGKIGFSAVAEPPKTFSGKGVLAYLKLKALKTGTATFSIEFTKGETTDSNVVQAQSNGKDILDKVINAYYSIKD